MIPAAIQAAENADITILVMGLDSVKQCLAFVFALFVRRGVVSVQCAD